ncbi:hypothetical protein C7M84_013798 [Penaeus vannamei]|uniref:Uncharacterized protein n=1 Tax=Penaeus vannamei TaxID=6689 RepID=A0A423SVA0_PENVA|nr:hypothetical protein C7M84_013798 [Penaeus vannamei]
MFHLFFPVLLSLLPSFLRIFPLSSLCHHPFLSPVSRFSFCLFSSFFRLVFFLSPCFHPFFLHVFTPVSSCSLLFFLPSVLSSPCSHPFLSPMFHFTCVFFLFFLFVSFLRSFFLPSIRSFSSMFHLFLFLSLLFFLPSFFLPLSIRFLSYIVSSHVFFLFLISPSYLPVSVVLSSPLFHRSVLHVSPGISSLCSFLLSSSFFLRSFFPLFHPFFLHVSRVLFLFSSLLSSFVLSFHSCSAFVPGPFFLHVFTCSLLFSSLLSSFVLSSPCSIHSFSMFHVFSSCSLLFFLPSFFLPLVPSILSPCFTCSLPVLFSSFSYPSFLPFFSYPLFVPIHSFIHVSRVLFLFSSLLLPLFHPIFPPCFHNSESEFVSDTGSDTEDKTEEDWDWSAALERYRSTRDYDQLAKDIARDIDSYLSSPHLKSMSASLNEEQRDIKYM